MCIRDRLEAMQRFDSLEERFSGYRAIWKLLFYFWGSFVGLGGFRGGWPGLFISVQRAYFKFSIEARLWEMEEAVTLESIERRYRALKENLIGNGQNL